MYVCMHLSIYVCMYVCIHAHMYIYIYIYITIYVCNIYIYIYIYISRLRVHGFDEVHLPLDLPAQLRLLLGARAANGKPYLP